MHLAFLAAFLLGLLLGVFSMLHGVERGARSSSVDGYGRPTGTVRRSFTPPTVAAFATSFGALGYLLTRYASLPASLTVLIAAGVALASVAGVVALIAKW